MLYKIDGITGDPLLGNRLRKSPLWIYSSPKSLLQAPNGFYYLFLSNELGDYNFLKLNSTLQIVIAKYINKEGTSGIRYMHSVVHVNGHLYWQGVHRYFGLDEDRTFVFKTDENLNTIDCCYDLSDTDNTPISEAAITVTILRDLKVGGVLVALDLTEPHFMYGPGEPFTTEDWDVNGL